MPFPNYPILPVDKTVKEQLDKHERAIYDHSASLINAGIQIESKRVIDLIEPMTEQIVAYVAAAKRNNQDVSPHQIASILWDNIDC